MAAPIGVAARLSMTCTSLEIRHAPGPAQPRVHWHPDGWTMETASSYSETNLLLGGADASSFEHGPRNALMRFGWLRRRGLCYYYIYLLIRVLL